MKPLCDLHIHLGASVAPHIMWAIAHEQGLKLPVKNYFDFVDIITVNPRKVKSLDDYLKILHEWTERIQSSPAAVERSVYEIIGKEYRSSRVERIELRFNPMKRNRQGERDLDHIIHAAIRGMDKAVMEYGVEAGLIFCLAREFTPQVNDIILNKAIKWADRGVIGIDVAGSEKNTINDGPPIEAYAKMFQKAREAGLGTTIHTGETPHTNGEGVIKAIRHLKPDRIGHGIRAAYSEEAMKQIVDSGVVLEVCPTSNLHTRAVRHLEEFKYILGAFIESKVPFTINTDGTYLCKTNLKREFNILNEARIINEEELEAARALAFKASFLENR
ncbi:MAG: adenosine deaminase [Proteobacteria bacterium]|nr:adenosine deaminase [Pseudomonadota bacterium]